MAYYAMTMWLVVHNNQIEQRREEKRGGERKQHDGFDHLIELKIDLYAHESVNAKNLLEPSYLSDVYLIPT